MTYEDLFLEGYYDAINEMESEEYNEYEEAYMEGYYAALNETSKTTRAKQVAMGVKMPKSNKKDISDIANKLKNKRRDNSWQSRWEDKKLGEFGNDKYGHKMYRGSVRRFNFDDGKYHSSQNNYTINKLTASSSGRNLHATADRTYTSDTTTRRFGKPDTYRDVFKY
jgi:bisphosphoglycerate-dependent phosphoglycerate mutase